MNVIISLDEIWHVTTVMGPQMRKHVMSARKTLHGFPSGWTTLAQYAMRQTEKTQGP